jgi:hypothetical protein
MNARDRDLSRLLSAVAMRAGARLVELRKTGGSHVRARFDRGGAMFNSSTPSDVREIKKHRGDGKTGAAMTDLFGATSADPVAEA